MMNRIKNRIRGLVSTSVQSELEEIRALCKENYWANVFNSSITGVPWMNNLPLNVGRWAGNYSLFYVLFRILNEIRPSNTLELGLGESSKLFQAYKQNHNKLATCISIEHDQEWIDIKTKNGISEEALEIIRVDLEEIKIQNSKTLIYKDLLKKLKALDRKFDLILIDGPFGSEEFSRYNIIEIVKNNLLNESFVIIFDDFHRKGEVQTFNNLLETLTTNGISFATGFYGGDKQQAVVCSSNNKFLTSL